MISIGLAVVLTIQKIAIGWPSGPVGSTLLWVIVGFFLFVGITGLGV